MVSRGEVPDISHLSGEQIERIANVLAAGNVDAILSRRKEIVDLEVEELNKLVDFAGATRANCGGFGCG